MTVSFDRPATSALRNSGEFAMAYLGSGTASRAPPSLAEVDVIGPLAVAGVPQLSATLADRHLRPPLGPPVWPVVVVSEPVCVVSVDVQPVDASWWPPAAP